VICDGHPEDVGGEVLQRSPAVSDGDGLDHPVFGPDHGIDLLQEASHLHGSPEAGAVELRERAVGDKEVGTRGDPVLSVLTHSTSACPKIGVSGSTPVDAPWCATPDSA
jgi:hypothetical protein